MLHSVSEGKNRNSFVEILRILCIFGILLMHKNGRFVDNATGVEIPWIMAVNLFNFESTFLMLVSAYYGNPFSSRKRLLKLWFMVIFYNYSVFIISSFSNGFLIDNLEQLMSAFFPIISGRSWFVSGYILILMGAPYIEKMLQTLDQKEFFEIIVLGVLFFFIIPTFSLCGMLSVSGKDAGTLFVAYLIGRYLNRFKILDRKSTRQYVLLAFISVILQLGLNGFCIAMWRVTLHKSGVILPFSWDHSFLELLLSISLLGIAYNNSFTNSVINVIGKCALGIMLAEGMVYLPFELLRQYQKIEFGMKYVLSVILSVVFVMIVGLVIESLRKLVFNSIENYFISKFVLLRRKIQNGEVKN
ncbi:acyltransferase family protein [Butyrivibrio proteoclasticus]|uniref:acyltransferase family protein n=1 Tax=Butyrivibrio proteoclasticus TaxID=43305 RepID=UPI00047E9938|nr:acyltransferase family protein [Butyrivibrio proteoclasticus]